MEPFCCLDTNKAPKLSQNIKRITILGATGSVGESVLSVINSQPDRFKVHAVVAKQSAEKLAKIAIEQQAKLAVLFDEAQLPVLRTALAGSGIECAAGPDAIQQAAAEDVDLVVAAIVGAAGIRPTWAALSAGNQIALANKECLVSAGELFTQEAKRQGLPILPVDSEHNAIWQVFENEQRASIEAVTLTASGGPFRTWSAEDIANATPQQALKHPNWSMGSKVTIDSASLMNKGLELIEAKYLFGLNAEQLRVVVHPQSIIHGFVHYADGSVLAQLGCADMRIPVACCLNWPNRGPSPGDKLDLAKMSSLTFEEADLTRFPCLQLAFDAMAGGAVLTNALNAANEVAVSSFLSGKIGFASIAQIVAKVLDDVSAINSTQVFQSIDDAIQCDLNARERALNYVVNSAL